MLEWKENYDIYLRSFWQPLLPDILTWQNSLNLVEGKTAACALNHETEKCLLRRVKSREAEIGCSSCIHSNSIHFNCCLLSNGVKQWWTNFVTRYPKGGLKSLRGSLKNKLNEELLKRFNFWGWRDEKVAWEWVREIIVSP